MAYLQSNEPFSYTKFKAPHKLIATSLAVALAVTPGTQAFGLTEVDALTDEVVAVSVEETAEESTQVDDTETLVTDTASTADASVDQNATQDAATATDTTDNSSTDTSATDAKDATSGDKTDAATDVDESGADESTDKDAGKTDSSDKTGDTGESADDKDAPSADDKAEDKDKDVTDGTNENPSDTAEQPSADVPAETPASDPAPAAQSTSTTSVYTTTHKTSTVVRHVSTNLTTQKFIALIGEQARDVAAENDLYASVMIAQAILESASGNSGLASAPNNNLFGIKGSYHGNSVAMSTQEDDGTGAMYTIVANFRKYDTLRESLEDYADLLTNQMGTYYVGALKTNAETYADACDFLQGRYATSTSYSASLQGLIEAYDLTKYDEPLAYEEVDSYQVQKTSDEGKLVYDEQGNPVYEERTLVDLVTELTSHMGEEYVWGGAECGSFDCSGLVYYSYNKALGITLPRVAEDQSKEGEEVTLITEDELLEQNNISTEGQTSDEAADTLKTELVSVDFDALHMGDLVFFEDSARGVYHVGAYLGEGCFIHAPQQGDVVKVSSLAEWEPSFAMRIVQVKEAGTEAEEPEVVQEVQATPDPEPEPELSAIEKAKLLAARTIHTFKDTLENLNQ